MSLSPEVRKAISEGALDFQMGATPDAEDHELVIHEIGWHLIHPETCSASRSGPRSHLTKATKSYRASGEVKSEPCRFQEIATQWEQPPAPMGVYRWKTPRGKLELKA